MQHKYRTNYLLKYVYTIRSIAKKERCENNHGEKNHHDATTFSRTTFNC